MHHPRTRTRRRPRRLIGRWIGHWIGAGALAMALAAPAAAQPPLELEGDVLVSPALASCTGSPSLATVLADGRLVVLFESVVPADPPPPVGVIQASIFAANGNPSGSGIVVATESGQSIAPLSVAADPAGGFLALWWRDDPPALLVRWFNRDGEPLGEEVEVLTALDGGTPTQRALLAPAPGGGWALVVSDGSRHRARWLDVEGRPASPVFDLATEGAGPGPIQDRLNRVAAAVDAAGDLLAVWDVQVLGTAPPFPTLGWQVRAARFGHSGQLLGSVAQVAAEGPDTRLSVPWVLTDPDGGSAAFWLRRETSGGSFIHSLQARRLDPSGQPSGNATALGPAGNFFSYHASTDAAGNWLLTWPEDGQIHAQAFSPEGVPLRSPVAFGTDLDPGDYAALPAIFPQPFGRAVALWQVGFIPPILPTGCEFYPQIYLQPLYAGCLEGRRELCLGADRFELEVAWHDQHNGGAGRGQTDPLTGDTGAFWFFSPDNLELVAKVLDGQPVNGRWWVFYGSLTDVEFHLTVRDLPRKLERTYHNPPGVFASRGDTAAFPGDEVPGGPAIGAAAGGSTSGGEPWAAGIGRLDRAAFTDPGADPVAAADGGADAVIAAAGVPPGPETYACPDLPITLCLRENRFLVEVTWSDPHNGGTGTGTAIPLTGDTGAFWFFDDANVELVAKVLDGRPVNGYWWLFYGSLTDVEFHLTVTDQATQTSQTYDNPPLSMASRGITDAFSDPGPLCPICSGGG